MKTKNIYLMAAVAMTASLLATSCKEDVEVGSPFMFGDGRLGFAIGTQDKWTPETRAEHNAISILTPDSVPGGEPLVVIVEDVLTGDSTTTAPDTRGMRYTNEVDDSGDYGWDGPDGTEHYMHSSFALFGMHYTDATLNFANATRWEGLSTGATSHTVIERPEGVSKSDSEHYEQWPWQEGEEAGLSIWPETGGVMLVACAPAQTDQDFGIRLTAEDNQAPYIEYTVPDMSIVQQDLMVAKHLMSEQDISNTFSGQNGTNPAITLDFQHICTAVKFKLAGNNDTNTGMANTSITSITMKNVRNKGTYTFNTTPTSWGEGNNFAEVGTWTTDADSRTDFTREFATPEQWTDGDKKVQGRTLTTDENVFMMIPQSFGNGDSYDNPPLEVNITYVDGNNEEVTLSTTITHTWRPGHTVIYTIAKAGAVTISEPQFIVTAVNDNGTELTRTYPYTTEPSSQYIAYTTPAAGTGNINFKVQSYRHFSVDGGVNGDAALPWEITQTELTDLDDNTDYTYTRKNDLLPKMIVMDASATTTVKDPDTGVETEMTVPVTWGDGGNADVLKAFTVNKDAQRGTADSEAMRNVLNRNPIGSDEVPQDLSKLSLDGKPMDTQSTANCYVVGAAGHYCIPMVYGNALMNGKTNKNAFLTEEVSGTTPNSLTAFVKSDGQPFDPTKPWIDENETGPYNAFILWSTHKDIITDVEVAQHDDGHSYVDFKVEEQNINLGNVLIAVANSSGDILWSWHIWVNDYDEVNRAINGTNRDGYEYDIMEVNLGWTDGYTETMADSICKFTFMQTETGTTKTVCIHRSEGTNPVPGTGGTYYQHGRKDPFPSVSVSLTETESIDTDGDDVNDKTVKVANDMMENQSTLLFNRPSDSRYKLEVERFTSSTGVADGIANPTKLYLPPTTSTSTNWFSGYYDNLWSMQPYVMDETSQAPNINFPVYKTIYDPCPIGFCIPNPGAFRDFYTTEEKDYYCNYHLDEAEYIKIYGSGATMSIPIYGDLGGAVLPPEGLQGNSIDLTYLANGFYTEQICVDAMKEALWKWGYTADDAYAAAGFLEGTYPQSGNNSVAIKSTGDFAHATAEVKWKDKADGFSDSRYDGIEGLVCTNWGNLFLPSAGARNPDNNGTTQITEGNKTFNTFNHGGYYATAFSAPDDGQMAATFFWIQRNRLRDEYANAIPNITGRQNRELISADVVPLFDPYNETVIDDAPFGTIANIDNAQSGSNLHRVWIYRNSSHSASNATNCWGNNSLGGAGLNMIPRVQNGSTKREGVYVYLLKHTGPQPYTPKEWGRKRNYAMSVRPIRDSKFTTDVGIAITNKGGNPYRETLSRQRK